MLREAMTESGAVRGIPGGDPRITVYRGIPYAKPPVGELRWEAPQPHPGWQGVRDAARFAPMAMQGRLGTNPGEFYTKELHPTAAEYEISEDCLYLNIWTPAESAEERLPVFFYIHGGGLTCGYPYEMEFDGEHTARKGCVMVTPGYRLGVFGFLAHPDLRDPSQGNFGFLDQVAALRWVKRNIAAFGGDPDRITVAGQSAGAASVTALLCSPLSKDLFQGAILMSGGGVESGDRFACSLEDAREAGVRFFRRLGAETVEAARALPAETVLEAQQAMYREDQDRASSPGIVYGGDFMPEHPLKVILSGGLPDIPYMIGCCRGEGKFFARLLGRETDPKDFGEIARRQFGPLAGKVLQMAEGLGEEGILQLLESDAFHMFRVGQEALARLLAAQGKTVYQYLFDHDIPGGDGAGSFHGSDLWFVFDSLARCWRPFTGKHYDLARAASSYFVNFVRDGDPNGEDWLGFPLPGWETYEENRRVRMCFEDVPVCREIRTDLLLDLRIESMIIGELQAGLEKLVRQFSGILGKKN